MKRYRLRNWVKNIIKVAMLLSALVVMSECESTIAFVLSHSIAIGVIVLGGILISE